MIARLVQSGLGLPDRDYYLQRRRQARPRSATAYQAYLAQLLTLAGEPNAAARAAAVARTSRRGIAEVALDPHREPRREQDLQQMGARRFRAQRAGLRLGRAISRRPALPASRTSSSRSRAPSPASPRLIGRDAARRCSRTSCWSARRQLAAPFLSQPFVDANFAFHGTAAQRHAAERGALEARRRPSSPARSRDDVGQIYVERYFPPEAKAAADELVRNVIAAMDRRLASLTWMAPETKARARAKLAAFTPKIGYPDRWRDYSSARDQPRRPARQRHARRPSSNIGATSTSSAGRSTAANGA